MVTEKQDRKPTCGIIMPISAIDDCSAEHWSDVLSILREVIEAANFEPNLVSDADEIGIIQKRIIQNVYSNEIVVCDVSGRNPNVMFELGMRLAFDKATIIVKDDHTNYTFDTSVIEHLEYPRDLRFNRIVEFKEKLRAKLVNTHKRSQSDPSFSTFLKNFGEYKVAHLERKEISSEAFVLQSLDEIKREIRLMRVKPEKRRAEPAIYCVPDHIEEFASHNKVFTVPGLRKRRRDLLEFIYSCGHDREDEAPLSSEIDDYLNRPEARKDLARLRDLPSQKPPNNGNQ